MASLNLPYSITNGTPTDATQVQSNFNAIKAFVEGDLVQADGTVKAGSIAIENDSITAEKIATGAVGSDELATNAVLEAKISNNAVSSAKLRTSAALSVMGRSANTSGNVADIAGTANQVLRVNNAGTTLAFGALNLESTDAITGQLLRANGGTGLNASSASNLLQQLNVYGKGTAAPAGWRLRTSTSAPGATAGDTGDIWIQY
jgi:hypothetical protein